MPHTLTKEAFDRLQAELAERTTKLRRKIAKQIREAREFGDLSENAAYKEAQEAELFNGSRIEHLENVLKSAKVLTGKQVAKDKVIIGANVELEQDGKKKTYQIVDSEEANPSKGKISSASPIGKALMGHKRGDCVVVQAPRGDISYTIVRIF